MNERYCPFVLFVCFNWKVNIYMEGLENKSKGTSNFANNPNFMCIKNGILRVLFSGRSFIDFQPLSDPGFERVNLLM